MYARGYALRAIFMPPHIEGLRSCVAYFVGVSGLFMFGL